MGLPIRFKPITAGSQTSNESLTQSQQPSKVNQGNKNNNQQIENERLLDSSVPGRQARTALSAFCMSGKQSHQNCKPETVQNRKTSGVSSELLNHRSSIKENVTENSMKPHTEDMLRVSSMSNTEDMIRHDLKERNADHLRVHQKELLISEERGDMNVVQKQHSRKGRAFQDWSNLSLTLSISSDEAEKPVSVRLRPRNRTNTPGSMDKILGIKNCDVNSDDLDLSANLELNERMNFQSDSDMAELESDYDLEASLKMKGAKQNSMPWVPKQNSGSLMEISSPFKTNMSDDKILNLRNQVCLILCALFFEGVFNDHQIKASEVQNECILNFQSCLSSKTLNSNYVADDLCHMLFTCWLNSLCSTSQDSRTVFLPEK